VCRAVYGRAYHKLLVNLRALHPALEDLVLVDAYGKVIGRPGLDLKRRELTTIAATAVLGAAQQLHSHLRGALNTGASAAEIEAVLALVDRDLDPERRRGAHEQWEDVRKRKL
jgi:4-carboxymuconolactone decarboxylase